MNNEITLRDYMAGQALIGLIQYCEKDDTPSMMVHEISHSAYAMADAMLRTRNYTQEEMEGA
jgi:hypothetical protein